MNTAMEGHNHGGKNHLLGMFGVAALVQGSARTGEASFNNRQ